MLLSKGFGVQFRNALVVILSSVMLMLCLSSCAQEAIQDHSIEPLAANVHDLRQDQSLPAELAGTWLRGFDQEVFDLEPGQALHNLGVGSYIKDEQVFCLRSDDSLAAYALSLRGLPSSPETDRQSLISWAEKRQRLNPVSMVVLSWRLADNFSWPWVSNVGLFDGLAGICAHYNMDKTGFAFDPERGVYVNSAGLPIIISDQAKPPQAWGERQSSDPIYIALGDVIAATDIDSTQPRFGLLVADRGKLGFLDPADDVMSAFVPPLHKPDKVEIWQLGYLMGPAPLHIYTRHKQRAISVLSRYRPDNPIWQLSKERQWMVLAGMIIMILVLMRQHRRWKKKLKD